MGLKFQFSCSKSYDQPHLRKIFGGKCMLCSNMAIPNLKIHDNVCKQEKMEPDEKKYSPPFHQQNLHIPAAALAILKPAFRKGKRYSVCTRCQSRAPQNADLFNFTCSFVFQIFRLVVNPGAGKRWRHWTSSRPSFRLWGEEECASRSLDWNDLSLKVCL